MGGETEAPEAVDGFGVDGYQFDTNWDGSQAEPHEPSDNEPKSTEDDADLERPVIERLQALVVTMKERRHDSHGRIPKELLQELQRLRTSGGMSSIKLGRSPRKRD
jgi:hypothetical protein